MASSDGTRQARKGATAVGDTDALVADIERTREELALTVDAIAEKVSPKRVIARAKVTVKEGALTAKERVLEAAGTAKGKVVESAGTAKELVAGAGDRTGTALGTGEDTVPHPVVPVEPPLAGRPGTLPPVGGVSVPRLAPGPMRSLPGAHAATTPAIPPEYLAVGAITAALALIVWWQGRRS